MRDEESKNFIIKLVLSNLQSIVNIIGQIIGIKGGEIRSLYLSPKALNGEREMIIEYEGGADSVDSLIKTVTKIEGCIRVVVTEFPAKIVQTDEEVHR